MRGVVLTLSLIALSGATLSSARADGTYKWSVTPMTGAGPGTLDIAHTAFLPAQGGSNQDSGRLNSAYTPPPPETDPRFRLLFTPLGAGLHVRAKLHW